MAKNDLQLWLFNNNGFKSKYRPLFLNSITSQFDTLSTSQSHELIDWNYLLTCASLFAQSKEAKYQEVSLRISNYCIQNKETNTTQKASAVVILDMLGNTPTIKLAENRNLVNRNILDDLPIVMYSDHVKRDLKNCIYLSGDKSIKVNNFQKDFWDLAQNNNWLSISAPTSAGKSYIFEYWLVHYIQQNNNPTIVYLVPTRALINQVMIDISSVLDENSILNYQISTLPIKSSLTEEKTNLLILTQERLHIFLTNKELKVDFVIIDEAHKIGDNYRGVLLQHALEELTERDRNCKVFFASPMTSNPEILLDDCPREITCAPLLSEEVTVNQNLFWISQIKGSPKKWTVEIINNEFKELIGDIDLDNNPTPESKRLPMLAHKLHNSTGGNVIYANGAAEAEKISKQIYDMEDYIDRESDLKKINDLIDLIKKTIHPKYNLIHVLKKGIAFHYGNIPLLVRNNIEELFNLGIVKFLICTSTLLEGVNMPCQNLFIRGPKKGSNNPMNETDFWNLAGRAGRWGKEFQGNIFCIDVKLDRVWKNGKPEKRKKYPIKRTTDTIINDNEFIEYISNFAPNDISIKKQNYEYVFSYLSSSFIRNSGLNNSIWSKRFDKDRLIDIEKMMKKLLEAKKVKDEVILDNPGVSMMSMENLYLYFSDRTDNVGKNIEELVPVHAESDNALDVYTQILHRINKQFGRHFGFAGRVRQLALLIVDWMKGYSLSRIISSREQYYKKNNSNYRLPNLIRDTMKDVETIARFLAPKYLSCYSDVLKQFLIDRNRADLANDIVDMNILLEFGVSQKTQLSLIGIGLSRSSAILLSELIIEDSLTELEVKKWLKNNSWITSELPDLIKVEIKSIIEKG
jgi:hypothetical protein